MVEQFIKKNTNKIKFLSNESNKEEQGQGLISITASMYYMYKQKIERVKLHYYLLHYQNSKFVIQKSISSGKNISKNNNKVKINT